MLVLLRHAMHHGRVYRNHAEEGEGLVQIDRLRAGELRHLHPTFFAQLLSCLEKDIKVGEPMRVQKRPREGESGGTVCVAAVLHICAGASIRAPAEHDNVAVREVAAAYLLHVLACPAAAYSRCHVAEGQIQHAG